MWDLIWTVISQIAVRVAVKLGAAAGEEIWVGRSLVTDIGLLATSSYFRSAK